MMLMHQKPSYVWADGCISFKELEQIKKLTQKKDEIVFAHTMKVLDALTIKNSITLWAALFHDLGKITTKVLSPDGIPFFHGHSEDSVIILRKVLSAWQEDPYIIDRVERIVLTHMLDLKHANDRTARNLFGKVGKNNIENWFALREADILAYPHAEGYINIYVQNFRKKVELYRTTLIRKNDLRISPSDGVMHICGGE